MQKTHEIIQSARELIGTPYLHQGRNAEIGLDCLGLLMHIAKVHDLKSIKDESIPLITLDEADYGLYPDSINLRAKLAENLSEINDLKEIKEGDIVLIRMNKNPQHLAIISDYPIEGELAMIHCYAQSGKVVEHLLDRKWCNRIEAVFRLS